VSKAISVCLSNVKAKDCWNQCLWCFTNNTCIDYPVRSILPPSSLCSLSNARWGVCWSVIPCPCSILLLEFIHSFLFSLKMHIPALLVDWSVLVQIHPSATIANSVALC
uniref:PTTG1 interacting protein n=1 Tax=Pavo cristatus TaxID=9049 RepID=A0A8C9G592_PAVCR